MDDPLLQRVRLVEPGPRARPSAGARPGARPAGPRGPSVRPARSSSIRLSEGRREPPASSPGRGGHTGKVPVAFPAGVLRPREINGAPTRGAATVRRHRSRFTRGRFGRSDRSPIGQQIEGHAGFKSCRPDCYMTAMSLQCDGKMGSVSMSRWTPLNPSWHFFRTTARRSGRGRSSLRPIPALSL